MGVAYLVLLLLAFVFFLCSAVTGLPQLPARWNMLAIGLALWTLADILRTVAAK